MIGRSGSITSTLNYETEIDKLNIISENILDIQTQNVPNELKIKLCNNFSCLYYSAVIQSYRIRPNKIENIFGKFYREKVGFVNILQKKDKSLYGISLTYLGFQRHQHC